jgi:hypothetical protein
MRIAYLHAIRDSSLYIHWLLHLFQPKPLRCLEHIKCRRTFFSTQLRI